MHSLSDKERNIERVFIPVHLPNLFINNNIYLYLFTLCQA